MLKCPYCEGTEIKTSEPDENNIRTQECVYCAKTWRTEITKKNSLENDAGEKLQSTEETLKERGNRYGEFSTHSKTSQGLKDVFLNGTFRAGKTSEDIPDYMWEAVEMICHKLARIANGDPMYDDNWRDIAGYAELVVKELNKD